MGGESFLPRYYCEKRKLFVCVYRVQRGARERKRPATQKSVFLKDCMASFNAALLIRKSGFLPGVHARVYRGYKEARARI